MSDPGDDAHLIRVPAGALVILIGISGSGKSTFAARHFRPTAILSSDALRGMVADDEADQSATDDAFAVLHQALGMRLGRRLLTVVDATNVRGWARQLLLQVAAARRRPAVAIVLDLPLDVCLERNAARTDRLVPSAAIRRQHRALLATLVALPAEGFVGIHHLTGPAAVDATRLVIEDGAQS